MPSTLGIVSAARLTEGFFTPTLGTVTTPDSPDLTITTRVRYTIKVLLPASVSAYQATQAHGSTPNRAFVFYFQAGQFLFGGEDSGGTFRAQSALNASELAPCLGREAIFRVDLTPGTPVQSQGSYSLDDGETWTVATQRSVTGLNDFRDPTTVLTSGGFTGRYYWSQMETLDAAGNPSAYLTPTVGTVSTPDPGPPPNEFCLVQRCRYGDLTNYPNVARQVEGAEPHSWYVYRTPNNGRYYLDLTPDGVWANKVARFTTGTIPPVATDVTHAVAVSLNNGSGRLTMRPWDRNETTGVWTAGTLSDTGTTVIPFDGTDALQIGLTFPANSRVYWTEMRTGLDPTAGTVVWRFDANDYPGTGTSYTDPRDRTWTLTNASAITPALMWRFNASEVPKVTPVFTDTLDTDTDLDGIADGWIGYTAGTAPSNTSRTMVDGHQRVAATFTAIGQYWGVQTAALHPVTVGQSYAMTATLSAVVTASSFAQIWYAYYSAAGAYLASGPSANISTNTPTPTEFAISQIVPASPTGIAQARPIIRLACPTTVDGVPVSADIYDVRFDQAQTYTDPRGRAWTVTNPAAITLNP